MKRLAFALISFCFLLLIGCSLQGQSNQPASNQTVTESDVKHSPATEQPNQMDTIKEEDNEQTFTLTDWSHDSEKTYQINIKDNAFLEELFDFDGMQQMPSTSENVIGYFFTRGKEEFLLSDTLDYVDAMIKDNENSYRYYARSLSEEETEALKALIESYTGR